MSRVLLLTSHPIDGRDGADKEIAMALLDGLGHVHYSYFGRAGRRPVARGRKLAVLSRTGLPGILERGQVALRAPVEARRVDLVHAVMTIGPHFARWSSSPLCPRARPLIHTVPGIADPEGLARSRPQPLGVTVALAETTAASLRGAGFRDVRVVPPGIDLERWQRRPRPSGGRPTLLFAGHFGASGGTDEAIHAAAAVERSGLPVRLVLALRHRAGHHVRREAEAVLAKAAALGLTEVAVHHRVDDMTRLVSDADVVLFLPRRLSEGKADVPLTVVESMAVGRPVVATDLPQLAALGDDVARVAPGDHLAASDAVLALLGSPARYDAAAERGAALVAKRFSAQAMCERYAEIYAELLDGPRAPSGGVNPQQG